MERKFLFFLAFVFHIYFSLTKALQVAHLKILNKAFCQGSCLGGRRQGVADRYGRGAGLIMMMMLPMVLMVMMIVMIQP